MEGHVNIILFKRLESSTLDTSRSTTFISCEGIVTDEPFTSKQTYYANGNKSNIPKSKFRPERLYYRESLQHVAHPAVCCVTQAFSDHESVSCSYRPNSNLLPCVTLAAWENSTLAECAPRLYNNNTFFGIQHYPRPDFTQ